MGILDKLAINLDLETVGEVQPKTELALKKIADKIVKDMEEEEKIKRSVKISMFLFNIGKKLAGVKPENKEIVRKELDTVANNNNIDSEKRVDLMNNIIAQHS